MAPTRGFALSALPRAPSIPSNVGKVDVAAMYDAVQRGLQTGNDLRMAAPRQRTELATLGLQAAKADAGVRTLPSETALALARNEQETLREPMQTQVLGSNRAILASKARPDVLESDASGTIADNKKRVEEEKFLSLPGMRERVTLARTLPQGVRQMSLYEQMLADPNTPEETKRAIRVQQGLAPRISGAAITYQKIVGPDGSEQLVAVDPRAVGAQIIGSGETYGSGVGGPLASRAPAPVTAPLAQTPQQIVAAPIGAVGDAAPATSAVNPFKGATPGEIAGQKATAEEKAKAENAGAIATAKTTAEEQAKLQADRQAKLPKAQSTLRAMEDKTAIVEDAINKARELVSDFSVGYGSLLDRVPKSDARALKSYLDTVRANIGFDALTEMRQNSPTGGALGNVSDYEGKTLQATIANMDTGLDPARFLDALNKVATVRKNSLARVKEAYERDFVLAGDPGAPLAPGAMPSPVPQASATAGASEFTSESEAAAAAAQGKIKAGDKIKVGGVSGTWQ